MEDLSTKIEELESKLKVLSEIKEGINTLKLENQNFAETKSQQMALFEKNLIALKLEQGQFVKQLDNVRSRIDHVETTRKDIKKQQNHAKVMLFISIGLLALVMIEKFIG